MDDSRKQTSFHHRCGSFPTALLARLRRRRTFLLLGLIFLANLGFWLRDEPVWARLLPGRPGPQIKHGGHVSASTEDTVSCLGPRGKRISVSPDDRIEFHNLGANPRPHAGSYEALGLEPEWATAEERYGPYGYRQDAGSNRREPVIWSEVNWGRLQAQCQRDNAHRFAKNWGPLFDASERRLQLRRPPGEHILGQNRSRRRHHPASSNGYTELTYEDPTAQQRPSRGASLASRGASTRQTNRTLLAMRVYDGYTYHEDDMTNIRSLISEAGLQSGGEYTVMLLVNVRDSDKKIFESEAAYAKAFEEAQIPEEFQSIAVLWDDQLLRSWYPKLDDHGLYYQVTQAMQLISVSYPEFDHFWLLEPDMRSHGHYLSFLQSLDRFSRNEPRKQSLERSSYFHIPSEQGPYYSGFLQSVNETVKGSSAVWGPLYIPEVPNPIGPVPPVSRPEDDNFEWGVGEPADLVSTGPCTWVFRSSWIFRDWFEGAWSLGDDTPRVFCPPATQRASRALLHAVHAAQMDQGLALPGESTLPSFAVWHGLKTSYPPQPVFQKNPPPDTRLADLYWNGGAPGECLRIAEMPNEGANVTTYAREDDPPRDFYKGSACGDGLLDGFLRLEWQTSLSWSFMSDFPQQVRDVWKRDPASDAEEEGEEEQAERQDEQEAMVYLKKHRGKWYAPAGWWHPIKTNILP